MKSAKRGHLWEYRQDRSGGSGNRISQLERKINQKGKRVRSVKDDPQFAGLGIPMDVDAACPTQGLESCGDPAWGQFSSEIDDFGGPSRRPKTCISHRVDADQHVDLCAEVCRSLAYRR